MDRNIIIENQPIFNIELPESKRYDQQDSWRCWIYGGLNVIKHNIAKNLNMNVIDLELSNNHIAFFDKLEKSNNAYENIINIKDTSFDYLHKENIIKYCVSEGGYWDEFVAIINKYGIVPYSYNPNAVESTNYEKVEYLYTEKVKKDIIELLNLKVNGTDINSLIAEMSSPSTGQGMELQEAVRLNIPIIIAKNGSKISSTVLGSGKIKKVVFYDEKEEIKGKFEDILND